MKMLTFPSAIRQAAWQSATLLLGALLFSGPSQADWVNSGQSGMPVDAIVGGHTTAGVRLYLCRAYHYRDVQPGWTSKGDPACHFSYGGQELSSTNFDWWVPSWIPVTGQPITQSYIPFWGESNAFRYVCRVGSTPGKYGTDLGGCLYPYGGAEQDQAGNGFELLVDPNDGNTYGAGETFPGSPITDGHVLGPYVARSAVSGVLPVDAIVGGTDAGGQPLYLCSAYVGDGYQPGKSRADWNACDVGYGGKENYESQYLVLVPDWAPETGGNFSYYPPWFSCTYYSNCQDTTRPIPIGTDTNGNVLYFCQVSTRSGVYPGKIGSGFSGCSYGLNGVENYSAAYNILTDGVNWAPMP